MSILTEKNNLTYVPSTMGIKYGIKSKKNAITLPVRFENEEEVMEFEKQVRELYYNATVNFNEILIPAPQQRTWSFSLLPPKRSLEGGLGINIKDSISIYYYLKELHYYAPNRIGHFGLSGINDSSVKNYCKRALDIILRKTMLGKKLKQYWVEKERITEEEAQKRLEEITPNA